jgi:hypothetical protein
VTVEVVGAAAPEPALAERVAAAGGRLSSTGGAPRGAARVIRACRRDERDAILAIVNAPPRRSAA